MDKTMTKDKVRVIDLARMKAERTPIAMLTAYDFPFARIFDAAGVDVLLVGDSLGMV
jgi:3-methyl-2-oxobutanoate hydroxymethyltransferase